jgi:hypothetical protein
MTGVSIRPDPVQWARKLHEAAAELRDKASRVPNGLTLASRLERYAEAILFPHHDRDRAPGMAAGDD